MTVDVEGNLYIAVCSYISTGKELPTNVAFGYDDDANLLYVTSGKSLYTIRMVKKGYHLKG